MSHNVLTASIVRPIVWDRQGGHCARCHTLMEPSNWEAHHRRRRGILDWCPCNIIGLHPRCHTQGPLAVHDHPAMARELGLIVPSYGPEPFDVPLLVRWPFSGEAFLACDGMVVSALARISTLP
jgi:hypothetical protein